MTDMTTAIATRRLLEALAELGNTPGLNIGTSPDPLAAFSIGIEHAMTLALASGQPGVARVFANLISLACAVRDEQKEPTS